MGGLGSWTAEYLTRAGIGRLRIADDDTVETSNLHRQALYTEEDALQKRLKVEAAADRLRAINSGCTVDVIAQRIDVLNMRRAAEGMDIILDGTDNYETRFLINDFAVKYSVPWIFAGVVEAQGQIMTIVLGKTSCLRCIIPTVPRCCEGQNECCCSGVLGTAVSFISAQQAIEAIKILSGKLDGINPFLTKYNLWDNHIQTIEAARMRRDDCACCIERDFSYLEP